VTPTGNSLSYYSDGNGGAIINILGAELRTEGRGIDARNTGIPNFENTELVKGRFQLINYSCAIAGQPDIYATTATSGEEVSRIATDCFSLLQFLNISKAHIFAHRQVGYAALKLALDHPDLIKSIALLDFEIVNSYLFNPKMQKAVSTMMQKRQNDPEYQQKMEMLRQMIEAAKSGTTVDGEPVDPTVAAELNSFPKELVEQFTAGAQNSDPFLMTVKGFATEMLSTSYADVASKITQPVLAAVWEDGPEWARESAVQLRGWLPQTEIFDVPKKSHWYSGQNDRGLADGLVQFYSKHPL